MKNSFSFSRYQLLKSKNSAGQIFGFHRFPKKYCRAISVRDVTGSQYEADLHMEHKDFVSSELGSQKVNFEDFYGIFQGIDNMLICHILIRYLSGHGLW